MHLDENALRAYLDGELPAREQELAAAHLADCTACQGELTALSDRARQVHAALDVLAPSPAVAPRETRAAWRTLEQTIQEKLPMSKRLARLRPLWAGLTLIAVLAIALSFSPVQALASSFLKLFRVQQVTVLPLDMTNLKDSRFNPTVGDTLGQILSEQVKITRQPAKAYEVADASAASKAAAFQVRLSGDPAQSLSRLMIQPGMAFEGTFNQTLVEQVLQGVGKGNLKLPAGLDGAVVKADIPDAVTAAYGQCRYNTAPETESPAGSQTIGVGDNCLILVQLPSPTVDTPPDLPVNKLAEIGLQVLGMTPDQAAKIANQIDWTTTLVIPVPTGQMDSQTVKADGVDATLLTQDPSAVARLKSYSVDPEGKGQVKTTQDVTVSSPRPTYTMVWVKNEIVYGILGSGDTAKAISLANSLK